jgi:uncharacterized membrane protein
VPPTPEIHNLGAKARPYHDTADYFAGHLFRRDVLFLRKGKLMRKWLLLLTTGAVIVAAALLLMTPPAEAQVTVCNHDHAEGHFAVAYLKTPSDWVAEGYTKLAAGTCTTLLKGKATPHPYYIYIVTAEGSSDGSKKFCVENTPFTTDHADVNTPSDARNCVTPSGIQEHGFVIRGRVAGFVRVDQVGEKNSSVVTFDSESVKVHPYSVFLGP